jgi:titin
MSREASNTLSFNVTGLLPLKSYQFKVSAINARGAGPASSVVSATTVAAAPSAPGSVKATIISSSGAALSWKKPTDTGGARVTNYKVETSRDNGNSWQVVRKKVSTSTKLTLSGLFAGTTYIVRVSAKNSAGFGTTAQVRFKTRAGAPSAPTNLRSSSVTGTKAVITWDLPASNGGKAIKNYRVEISSNCSTYTVLRRTASNSLVQTVTKLKPRTQYCFRVSTITSLGTSEASKVLKIKTKARN